MDDLAVAHGEDPALGELALAQARAERPLDDLERVAGRGEEELVVSPAEPEGPADAACDVEQLGLALVEPGGRHRAVQLLEGPRDPSSELSARAKITSESTLISGSARSMPCSASSSSSLKMIPLWIPTTAPWRTGWLFAAIVGWPFV